MSNAPGPQSVIEVKTSFFPLAFLLALFKPQVSINGAPPFQTRWGQTPVPVPPGRYQVEVWLPYLFFTQMGKNGVIVDVPPGGAVRVWWRAPWLVFLKGTITVEDLSAVDARQDPTVSAAAGGWHPDPAGRHEQRYFDGTGWTDHVVSGGVQSTDAVGGPR